MSTLFLEEQKVQSKIIRYVGGRSWQLQVQQLSLDPVAITSVVLKTPQGQEAATFIAADYSIADKRGYREQVCQTPRECQFRVI